MATGPPDLAHAGRTATTLAREAVERAFFADRADPLARFLGLLALARSVPEELQPTAMTLSTLGESGPASRVVLLKDAGARGLTFFTNKDSAKGKNLAREPRAALAFYWAGLEVQVRVEGRASEVPDAESDAYFATRPRGSQLGAWASAQSAPLVSREQLEARLAEVTARFAGQDVPRPPRWGGYCVEPARWEFWKGSPDRLHVREVYEKDAGGWGMSLLNP